MFIRLTYCMFAWMGISFRIRNTANRSARPAVAACFVILFSGGSSTRSTRRAAGDFPSNEIELREADLDKWRDLISPTADELAFERITWSPSLGEGLERASVEQKPLLLWMMNGHPLGRT